MRKRRLISAACLIPIVSKNMLEAVKIGQPAIADHAAKQNINFYQTKIHRCKKGGKINFRGG